MQVEERARAPIAKVEPTVVVTHGDERIDPYAWMRDRESPEVLAYLEAENAYTAAMTAHTADLRERLYAEMVGRIKETDESAPVPEDDYFYYHRTVEGLQYPIHCRKKGSLDAPEEVYLDENELAEGHDYFRAGVLETSRDHALLVYSTDTDGSEQFTLRVKDLRTGALLPDRIENTSYSCAWDNAGTSFLYTVLDESKRPYKVFRHVLGTDPATDAMVHHEADESFYCSVGATKTRRYVFIIIGSNTTTEYRILDAEDLSAPPVVFAPRRNGIEYHMRHQGDRFLVWSNEDAKNFALYEAPCDDPRRESWRELIPHREETKIEGVEPFASHLAILERTDGLLHIRVEGPDGVHHVEMPEPVYVAYPAANLVYDTNVLRFGYTSLVTPTSTFAYDMDSRERTLVKQQEVLGGFDPADYVCERVFARAPDGVEVPMSIVRRADRAPGGPGLLYGYGSYGMSMDPTFNSSRLALLDRGLVFAIAHIRGGGDLGERWRDDGKLAKKMNTFTDFIACAEHLIDSGLVGRDVLAIQGGSAGGLLMGAVTNLRPDLFHVVVAQVPFVDVVNTMLDASLPLTVMEYEEWGNPNEPEAYATIRAYSPYDNIAATDYPAMLVTSGINDPRVQYWEPTKYVARLRATKTDSNVLLLKMKMESGHGGPSGRYDYLRDLAFVYAFVLDQLGVAA